MTELWRIEDEVRGKDADSRAARRQEKSSTTVASLFELWEKELGKVSGKSKTPAARAAHELGRRWPRCCRPAK